MVTIDKLRSTFVRYEQKRDLLKSYERILADEAIVPMIPSVLGKACMKAKKHPVPVKLDWETDKLKKNLEKGLSTALLFVNCATTTSVRTGKLSFTDEELLANIRCVLVHRLQPHCEHLLEGGCATAYSLLVHRLGRHSILREAPGFVCRGEGEDAREGEVRLLF